MYEDPILKKYKDLVEQATGEFKKIYFGDPIHVPQSLTPALILSKTRTRVANRDNQQDDQEVEITMTVITDIRKDINTSEGSQAIVQGANSLYNIVEGRNDDYTLKDTSLLHILRNNVTLDPSNNLRTDIDSVTDVDYGFLIGKRELEMLSVEATITFVANFYQIR